MLDIDAAGIIHRNAAGEGHAHALVCFGVATQLAEGQFHGVAVIIIGILLAGIEVQLAVLGL